VTAAAHPDDTGTPFDRTPAGYDRRYDPWRCKAVPSVDDDDSPIRLDVIVSIPESDPICLRCSSSSGDIRSSRVAARRAGALKALVQIQPAEAPTAYSASADDKHQRPTPL
jgi:hypothetical protein